MENPRKQVEVHIESEFKIPFQKSFRNPLTFSPRSARVICACFVVCRSAHIYTSRCTLVGGGRIGKREGRVQKFRPNTSVSGSSAAGAQKFSFFDRKKNPSSFRPAYEECQVVCVRTIFWPFCCCWMKMLGRSTMCSCRCYCVSMIFSFSLFVSRVGTKKKTTPKSYHHSDKFQAKIHGSARKRAVAVIAAIGKTSLFLPWHRLPPPSCVAKHFP